MEKERPGLGEDHCFSSRGIKGISEQHPATFQKSLKERILNTVRRGKVYFINGDAENLRILMRM